MSQKPAVRGVILYGPPAAGKDTVTSALTSLDPTYSLFSRVKVGPGRSAGYRMGTPEQLQELRASGAVVYENARYDSTYVTDRPGLDAAAAAGVPVMHLGQVDGVRVVLDSYPGRWLTVLLWCPRETTAARSARRGDVDTPARLAAWDATRADLAANSGFAFDLTIRTDEVVPEAAAAQIRRALSSELVLVDFDDTLIDRLASVTAWVARYCAGHGLGREVEQRMLEAMRIRADLDVIERLCAELGLPESASELWSRYETELVMSVKPFPGVIEALAAVREAGHQVVVVTNGGAQIQRAKLKASGIADVVDAVCISGAIGIRKPERQIFEAAAASVGRDLAQGGWMIGDNADLDVAGGREAGLRTVWISHGQSWLGGAEPDIVARTAVEAFVHVVEGAR
ncbi:HAD-IA family hydrolase [Kitasatospora sp. RG8]|uniref:HAD family hydrolase n=1 Tax=Kitasatospora sp. RG8 TaxID=2820815 RepID=UPI001ADEDAA8|nr:HAD-IA family hydrolase [Kitasatospora sp. RG8]MBP0453970.1 HAD-IA family hydrolase [Kitasatospora sp. RG8]